MHVPSWAWHFSGITQRPQLLQTPDPTLMNQVGEMSPVLTALWGHRLLETCPPWEGMGSQRLPEMDCQGSWWNHDWIWLEVLGFGGCSRVIFCECHISGRPVSLVSFLKLLYLPNGRPYQPPPTPPHPSHHFPTPHNALPISPHPTLLRMPPGPYVLICTQLANWAQPSSTSWPISLPKQPPALRRIRVGEGDTCLWAWKIAFLHMQGKMQVVLAGTGSIRRQHRWKYVQWQRKKAGVGQKQHHGEAGNVSLLKPPNRSELPHGQFEKCIQSRNPFFQVCTEKPGPVWRSSARTPGPEGWPWTSQAGWFLLWC